MIKEVVKKCYITSDGSEFVERELAVKHEKVLDIDSLLSGGFSKGLQFDERIDVAKFLMENREKFLEILSRTY